jgi:hypothetical protein
MKYGKTEYSLDPSYFKKTYLYCGNTKVTGAREAIIEDIEIKKK